MQVDYFDLTRLRTIRWKEKDYMTCCENNFRKRNPNISYWEFRRTMTAFIKTIRKLKIPKVDGLKYLKYYLKLPQGSSKTFEEYIKIKLKDEQSYDN